MILTIKRLLITPEGRVSMTKVGTTLLTVAGAVLMAPEAASQVGITLVLPGSVKLAAWLITFVGVKIAADGARDAISRGAK